MQDKNSATAHGSELDRLTWSLLWMSLTTRLVGRTSPAPIGGVAVDSSHPPSHDSVAVLRAVTCLGVVAWHFFPRDLAEWPFAASSFPSPFWIVTNLRLGYESFFVLAGFFLAFTSQPGPSNHFSVSDYFCRRLLRLAIPYWVALLAVGA